MHKVSLATHRGSSEKKTRKSSKRKGRNRQEEAAPALLYQPCEFVRLRALPWGRQHGEEPGDARPALRGKTIHLGDEGGFCGGEQGPRAG